MNKGFKLHLDFFQPEEINELEQAVLSFYKGWKNDHHEKFEKGAINCSYLTSKKLNSLINREIYFKFIDSNKIAYLLDELFPNKTARFLNTQLFFDPHDSFQKNYWHRDIQYTGYDLGKQKSEILENPNNIIHLRIPLTDDPGLELIPGTHNRWDNDQEFKVRVEDKGRNSHLPLSGSKLLKPNKNDLLVFSANMIHRGHYGGNRLVFDIVFYKENPNMKNFMDEDCLPTKNELAS